MTPDPEFASFARLIDSLSPWLDQVVIIGGWAHRLYRFHPSAQRLDYPSLSTFDTDVAVPARIAVKEQDIHGVPAKIKGPAPSAIIPRQERVNPPRVIAGH